MSDEPMDRLRGSVPDDHRMAAGPADRLEAALRVAHAGRAASPHHVPAWRRPVAFGAIAVVIVVAMVATLVLRDPAPSAALVLRDAAGVTVVLPDGSEVSDPADGFELPDGAIVSIAAGGMATIDETTIRAAAVLEVRDGALISRVDISTTTVADADGPAVASTTTSIAPERATTTTTTTTVPDRDRPADTSTTIETTDDRRRDRSTTTHPPPRHRDDESSEPDRQPDAAIEIELRLEPVDDGVRIRWAVAALDDGWQVVIQRRIGEGERVVVAGPTAAAEGDVVDRPDVSPRRDGPEVRYRVVVLDAAGGVVGAGPFQSVRR